MSYDPVQETPPRRQRFEHLEVRRGQSGLSGSVTAAGVCTIVMGGLSLVCFFCSGIVGLFFVGLSEVGRQQGNFLPGFIGATGGILLGFAALYLLVGVGYLVAGIGTLQRASWGRVFALCMGGVSVIFAVLQLVFVVLGLMGLDPFMQADEPESQLGGAIVNSLAALLYLAHAAVVFIILMNSYNIAEFE